MSEREAASVPRPVTEPSSRRLPGRYKIRATGFAPATVRPPAECATKLRHALLILPPGIAPGIRASEARVFAVGPWEQDAFAGICTQNSSLGERRDGCFTTQAQALAQSRTEVSRLRNGYLAVGLQGQDARPPRKVHSRPRMGLPRPDEQRRAEESHPIPFRGPTGFSGYSQNGEGRTCTPATTGPTDFQPVLAP